jgi:SAM-dependent methyltransferase
VTRLPKAYLSACAVYRNESPYLREWIEFHRVVGVERFFLYNHASVDDHRRALAPYIEDGIVTLEDWPDLASVQNDVYDHCLERNRPNSRWIAFIDIDEFLFSPSGRPLPELLVEYEAFPGVAANWAEFGTSGHLSRPPGLVIESYLWRSNETRVNRNKGFKSIVDPVRVIRCLGPHQFAFTEGCLVDERKQPVEGRVTKRPLYSKFRINHYYTRSEDECARKFTRPQANNAALRGSGEAPLERLHETHNDTRDETILVHAPAVKKALAEVNRRAPFDAAQSTAASGRDADRILRALTEGAARSREWGPAALRCIEAAIECARRLLPPAALESKQFDRILDFPCGRGRVLRVLRAAFPDAEITAGDVDREAVDFCAELFGARPLYADRDPARIETDASFDLIWSGSFFTRLDADRWLPFLEFLESRLRPWGILVFTTLGRLERNALPGELEPEVAKAMRTELLQEGFSYRGGRSGSDSSIAIASPAWVCRKLEARPGLWLVTYAERGWNHAQDAIACARVGPRWLIKEIVESQETISVRQLVEATGYDEPTVSRLLEALGSRPE